VIHLAHFSAKGQVKVVPFAYAAALRCFRLLGKIEVVSLLLTILLLALAGYVFVRYCRSFGHGRDQTRIAIYSHERYTD
jgi:hypothetical protein